MARRYQQIADDNLSNLGGEFYSGSGDPYIVFPDPSVVALTGCVNSKKGYGVDIINTFNRDIKIVVFPGGGFDVLGINGSVIHYHDIAAIKRYLKDVDCVVDDGVVLVDSVDPTQYVETKTTTNISIRQWINHTLNHPKRIIGMSVNSDVNALFSRTLEVMYVQPEIPQDKMDISLQEAFSVNQTQSNKIAVKEQPFDLNDASLVVITIPAKSKSNLFFYVGAFMDESAYLGRAIDLSKEHPSVQGHTNY